MSSFQENFVFCVLIYEVSCENIVLSYAGIFEKHKLLFSFQITIKLEQDQSHVTQEELDFYIKVQIPFFLFTFSKMYYPVP